MNPVTQQFIQRLYNEGYTPKNKVLYDSLFTTANTRQTLTYFQNTIGGVTRVRTNMGQAGQIPAGSYMFVQSIECQIFNTSGAAFFTIATGASTAVEYPVNAMIAKGHFDIVLGSDTIYEGHMSQMEGAVNRMEDAPASKLGSAVIKGFSFRSIDFTNPLVIMAGKSFKLVLELTTPAAAGGYVANDTLIYWYLNGVMFEKV